MKLIELSQGKFAKIDDEDFGRVSQFKWSVFVRPHASYAVRRERLSDGSRKSIYLHRFVMAEPIGMMVDHENHDGLDCQKSNLRVCSNSKNQMNRIGAQKNSTSGRRGVSWRKDKSRWQAQIKLDGRLKYLGLFDSIEDASTAYACANKKYFAEFGGST